MACGSTYPCPLCYAKKGLLRDIGDPRLWSEIISLCEQWMKSIRVDHVRYHGGKELGKFVKYKLFFEQKY